MKITYNTKNINMINEMARLALLDTAEAVKTDLIQSQTMPFDTGTMQNDSTFVDDKKVIKGVAKIVVDTVYARKVYFDPEIHIKQGKNLTQNNIILMIIQLEARRIYQLNILNKC